MIVKDNAVSLAVADEVSLVTRIRGTLAAPDGLCLSVIAGIFVLYFPRVSSRGPYLSF